MALKMLLLSTVAVALLGQAAAYGDAGQYGYGYPGAYVSYGYEAPLSTGDYSYGGSPGLYSYGGYGGYDGGYGGYDGGYYGSYEAMPSAGRLARRLLMDAPTTASRCGSKNWGVDVGVLGPRTELVGRLRACQMNRVSGALHTSDLRPSSLLPSPTLPPHPLSPTLKP